MRLDPSGGIALFTDGSANYRDRSGGWGWVALDAFEGLVTDSGSLGDTTISQMELLAAIRGLQTIYGHYGSRAVLVYSDSEYVVKGANNRKRARRKNVSYWNKLDTAIARHSYVEFNHVRGHSDHRFNEMADQLAGDARRKGAK